LALTYVGKEFAWKWLWLLARRNYPKLEDAWSKYGSSVFLPDLFVKLAFGIANSDLLELNQEANCELDLK
jgi:hypothetical protein